MFQEHHRGFFKRFVLAIAHFFGFWPKVRYRSVLHFKQVVCFWFRWFICRLRCLYVSLHFNKNLKLTWSWPHLPDMSQLSHSLSGSHLSQREQKPRLASPASRRNRRLPCRVRPARISSPSMCRWVKARRSRECSSQHGYQLVQDILKNPLYSLEKSFPLSYSTIIHYIHWKTMENI